MTSTYEREDDAPDCLCERCGAGFDMTDCNLEAWEMLGLVVCPDCADDTFEQESEHAHHQQ